MSSFTTIQRQRWMRLLACAPPSLLEQHWLKIEASVPQYTIIRQPEVGLTMVQARSCGNGSPFNFGEMPLTRCAVRVGDIVGHGYVQGRKKSHAFHMALFDALLQTDSFNEQIEETLLTQLFVKVEEKRERRQKEAQNTKVDFFTMVRGENDK